jgi:hypothetical protein
MVRWRGSHFYDLQDRSPPFKLAELKNTAINTARSIYAGNLVLHVRTGLPYAHDRLTASAKLPSQRCNGLPLTKLLGGVIIMKNFIKININERYFSGVR